MKTMTKTILAMAAVCCALICLTACSGNNNAVVTSGGGISGEIVTTTTVFTGKLSMDVVLEYSMVGNAQSIWKDLQRYNYTAAEDGTLQFALDDQIFSGTLNVTLNEAGEAQTLTLVHGASGRTFDLLGSGSLTDFIRSCR